MPSTCVFEFDRPDPVYYSGEIINGRIQLTTTSEKSVRDVYINFEGQAKVRWEERKSRSENGKTHHYTEHFRATETYLNTRTVVFGEGTLPVGLHTYTFSIPLPLECPTSCVEEYGRISYELSLVINRPFRFDNVFNQPLTVIRQLNLNLSPELLIPLSNEDVKYFCCWFCSSGPLTSTLTIPFGGYAPGQAIKYRLEVDNQSKGYDIDNGVRLKLIQTYKFVAHTPHHKTRYHSNTLASTAEFQHVLRLSKKLIEGDLLIPPVPPTSVGSGIITVHYEIKMIIDTGSCHTDQEICIPIQIGTVPLAQSATDPSHALTLPPTAPPDTPDSPDTPTDKPPSYDQYKPPSFEEATTGGKFIDTDVDVHNRTEGFIPRYPMYTNFAVPTAPPRMQSEETCELTPLQLDNNTQTPPYPIGDIIMPQPPVERNDGYGWRN